MSDKKVKILGVAVNSNQEKELLNEIVGCALGIGKENKKSLVVFTPNPEFLVEAQRNRDFRDLLNKADINLPDGIGLVWASKLLGRKIERRISGADVVEKILEEGNKVSSKFRVGIVGARRGEKKEVGVLLERLGKKYPGVEFVELDKEKEGGGLGEGEFNVIFACQGMGRQEEWIWKNREKFPANVFMGIGGSLDFLTGFTKRAPGWMRRWGLEWLWRGFKRPAHFKRIWRATFVFGWEVMKELVGKN